MNKEEIKLNDKELHKAIDNLKGTQFLDAFCIIDWIVKTRDENKELQQEKRQLETNKDVVFTREETEKLLKEFQELDKCDTTLTNSLMLRRKTFENEILKKKVKQLESNRDEALNLMEKCKFDKTDKYIAISEYKEYQELKAILERGKK